MEINLNTTVIVMLLVICSCSRSKIEEATEIENGIKKVGQFKNGKLHGSLKKYDSLERLISESNYVNGVIDGKYSEYYESGEVMYEAYYDLGIKDGTLKHYQKNGELWEYFYYINDTIQYIKAFDENGSLIKFFIGFKIELTKENDSLRIDATLLHSNLNKIETGIVLYGNSKSEKISSKKNNSEEVTLKIHKKLFDEYINLSVEVGEVESNAMFIKCEAPIEYLNHKKNYYCEWTDKVYEEVEKNFSN